VTPLSLGIETLGGVMTKLIDKNTTIPTKAQQVFSTAEDNQTAVTVHVLQGERDMASGNKSLGRFDLTDIPTAPRGVPQIEVTFDIDANGILNVSAKDKATGKQQHIIIKASSGLSDDEIDRMVKDAEQHASEDKSKRDDVEQRNRLDSLVYEVEKNSKEWADRLDETQKKRLDDAVESAKKALRSGAAPEIAFAVNRLSGGFTITAGAQLIVDEATGELLTLESSGVALIAVTRRDGGDTLTAWPRTAGGFAAPVSVALLGEFLGANGDTLFTRHGRLLDGDLQQGALRGVHGGVPQLLGVHLTEAFQPPELGLVIGVLLEEHVLRVIVLEIHLRLRDLGGVQGRLGDVHMTPFDELSHLAEQERQQQRPDVAAVDVGVGQQDDLVVADLLDVEVLAEAGADGRDERLDLGVLQHLVDPGAFDVEDLAADGQDRHDPRVAGVLGGSPRRVALDDVELGLAWLAARAVGELAG